jgi:hypothetical protein
VPLTTKKASGKTNSSEQEEPEGNQKSYKPAAGARMPQPGKQVGRRRICTLMVVTFHRLTRSLPLDIDAKVSFYNLSPATVIAPSPAAVATTATPAAPVDQQQALYLEEPAQR